jgi:hypothetical protein
VKLDSRFRGNDSYEMACGELGPKTQFDGQEKLVFAVRYGLCELRIGAKKAAKCSYQGRF